MTYLFISLLAFVQNVSFSITSRARNRDNFYYHAAASAFSNGIWLITIGIIVKSDFSIYTAIPYIMGTVSGSLAGAKISIRIEEIIGAKV